MSHRTDLGARIDAEFAALDAKIKRAQNEQVREHQERQERLRLFEHQLHTLADIWSPRLRALIDHFGDRVQTKPNLTRTTREVDLQFQSDLARIHLRFSAATDHDVRNLILNYDLEIIPVLMQYDSHVHAEWPLAAVNEQTVGAWVDDRIIGFVRTYLSLHENEYYLKEHMVTDPVANVRFPRFAAATSLEVEGKQYYFVGEETRRQFEAQRGIESR